MSCNEFKHGAFLGSSAPLASAQRASNTATHPRRSCGCSTERTAITPRSGGSARRKEVRQQLWHAGQRERKGRVQRKRRRRATSLSAAARAIKRATCRSWKVYVLSGCADKMFALSSSCTLCLGKR